jgi:hypothetical protein
MRPITILNAEKMKHGSKVRLNVRSGGRMRLSKLWIFPFCLSLSLGVVAQESTTPAPAPAPKTAQAHHIRTVRLSGKVSDDGTRFIDEASRRVWLVKNVEALKGFESQLALLRGRVDGDTNLIQVLSIVIQETHSAHLSDSAFRR